ncbi:MAG: DUF7706 family protein [Halobacteriota archaeon]
MKIHRDNEDLDASNAIIIDKLNVDLTCREAQALAVFLKKVRLSNFKALAEDEDEACEMRDAGEKIRYALIRCGFNPY